MTVFGRNISAWLILIGQYLFCLLCLRGLFLFRSATDVTGLGLASDLAIPTLGSSAESCFWFPPSWVKLPPPCFWAEAVWFLCHTDQKLWPNSQPWFYETRTLFFPDALGNYFMTKSFFFFFSLLGDGNWHHAARPADGEYLRQRTAGC